ncbi:MAG TPA: sigma-54 dependent transcriptional regulator [Candidatus Dormibacteraeota bacterium]|nr:sigma-54 dependent transcriptional regulator [Candidatus Dormibacteraeota bacterium]
MRDRSILIVEDDPCAAQFMALAMKEEFDGVRTAPNGTEALLAMESRVPDLIFMDLGLPDMDGLELLTMLKQRWPEVPVILVTAADDVASVVESVQRGATNYLVKPVAPAVLLASARKAVSTAAAPRSHAESGIPEIVGMSRAVVQVRHLIFLAARSDVNVLITGATGTGKELVARAVHRLSSLSTGPFVAHNCSLTPPDLFESQFFGHHRGSFTGADRDHVGLLEKSHGGTLLLDELECLSLPHQAKLLRVLDDGEVRPVGSSESRTVLVRFLAATNRDPQKMMGQGSLREDLYYRLRGLEISLPPLRERRGDVPLLASHFLGDHEGAFTPEALVALQDYSWPGNVRELRNVVRRARSLAVDRPISGRDLALRPAPAVIPDDLARPMGSPIAAGQALKEAERSTIVQALRDAGGRQTEAARTLGIDRSTLRRKVRRFGINPSRPDR